MCIAQHSIERVHESNSNLIIKVYMFVIMDKFKFHLLDIMVFMFESIHVYSNWTEDYNSVFVLRSYLVVYKQSRSGARWCGEIVRCVSTT